jgi:Zn finger protein HypA/HybF involved in hydrogenase expression
VKPHTGPLTTLGNAATAKVRLIMWCRDCQHRVEPDPAEHAARYGADVAVVDWVKRLKCSQCGGRSVDFVLTGARR